MSDCNGGLRRFGIMGFFEADKWGDVFRRVVSDVRRLSVEANVSATIQITVLSGTDLPDSHPSIKMIREQVNQLGFVMYGIPDTADDEDLFTQEERDLLNYFDEADHLVRAGAKLRRSSAKPKKQGA